MSSSDEDMDDRVIKYKRKGCVRMKERSLQDKLDFIRSCETGFVVDAMNLLGLRRWWMEGIVPLKEGQKMVGQAYTVRLERVRKDEPAYNAYDAVENCPAGHVLCIANIKETFLIGGNVMTLASNKGIAGVVLEASNRDVADTKKLPMPVFSQGVGAKVLPSDIRVTFNLDVPIEIGNGKIYPGDIVVGDDDGVVVIPLEELDNVLFQLEMVAEVEKEAAEALEKNLYSPVEFFHKIISKKKKPRK